MFDLLDSDFVLNNHDMNTINSSTILKISFYSGRNLINSFMVSFYSIQLFNSLILFMVCVRTLGLGQKEILDETLVLTFFN